MIRECFRMKTGIQFEADRLYDLGIDPHTVYPKVLRRSPKNFDVEKPLPHVPQQVDTPPASASASAHVPDASADGRDHQHRRHQHHSLDGTLVEHHRETSVSQTDEQFGDETIHRTETTVIDEKDRVEDEDEKPLYAHSKGTSTSIEDKEDQQDASCPVYDQLKLNKWWWALEYLPLRERVRQADGTWKKKWM